MPSSRSPEQVSAVPPSMTEDTARPAAPAMPGKAPRDRLWPIWLAAFAAALALYVATVAPDVLMMDSGEYHWSTWLFPHNPLPQGPQNLVRMHVNYLLSAKVFALLIPVGSWFLRINLFSAFTASLAAGSVAALTFALTRSRAATTLTFLALVLGQTTWEYSVIAEVLAMQAAAASAELLLLYLWTRSDKWHWLLALWLVNGFAAGAHVQNGLASPVYLILTVIAFREGRVRLWQALACAAVWLAAFSPFLVMCLHEAHAAGGWRMSLGSATAGAYGSRMWQMNPRIWLRGVLYIGLNYPTGLALLCIPGLAGLYGSSVSRLFKWGWLAVLGINLLFVMTYNVPDQQSFFVPVYAILAPLIGLGAALVLRSRVTWAEAFGLAVLVIPVYAVLPEVLQNPKVAARLPVPKISQGVPYRDPYEFYLVPWKTGWRGERRYIEEVLGILPEDSFFFCGSTIHDGLQAVQTVESRHVRLELDPAPESIAANLVREAGRRNEWRKPIYLWIPRGRGVPEAFSRHCRLIPRDLVWEVLPPEDADAFLRDLRE